MTATCSESCSRDAISCDTGLPVHIDTPKSPVAIPPSHLPNWT